MSARMRLALATTAATFAALPSAASAANSGYQFDQFKIVGPGRLVIEATAPKQVPGLPPSARGYHEVCATTVSPILRYRVRWSAPGDASSFDVRGLWARPGTSAYTPLGTSKFTMLNVVTYNAPFTKDAPLQGWHFLPSGTAGPIATAPPVALLDLRVIVRTSYVVPILIPGSMPTGFSIPTEQALHTKLDFRVSPSKDCPTPATFKTWLRAR